MFGPDEWLKLEKMMEDTVTKGVKQALSDVGLGFDNEEGKNALREDRTWTRQARLASESRVRHVRKGVWTAFTVAMSGAAMYALMHLPDFMHWMTTVYAASR